ncbi:hypothetical protein ACFLYF_05215 [Chloroflexota bacterium]
MNQDDKECNVVEKLASNEESIAKLYKGYADAYPVLSQFWISLATEEMQHASWIRSLGEKTGTSPIYIDEQRFNTVAINSFMNYLDKELAKVYEGKIPLIEALSITFYVEKSLIESRFFEVFQTDSAELKHVLMKIRDETIVHCKKPKINWIHIRKAINSTFTRYPVGIGLVQIHSLPLNLSLIS